MIHATDVKHTLAAATIRDERDAIEDWFAKCSQERAPTSFEARRRVGIRVYSAPMHIGSVLRCSLPASRGQSSCVKDGRNVSGFVPDHDPSVGFEDVTELD